MQRIIRIDRQAVVGRPAVVERQTGVNGTSPAAEATVELEILRGSARQLRREVSVPVFLIGTADDCDLVLGDAGIPEVHTYLYVRPGRGVSIRTLGAEPALKVGGRAVETVTLHDGDWFSIGPFEFRVHIAHRPPHDPLRNGRRRRHDGHDALGKRDEIRPGIADERDCCDARELLAELQVVQRWELRLYVERQTALISSAGWRRLAGRASA